LKDLRVFRLWRKERDLSIRPRRKVPLLSLIKLRREKSNASRSRRCERKRWLKCRDRLKL